MSNKDNFQDLLRAMAYADSLQIAQDQMPNERCVDFCKRQKAPTGFNIWVFLMQQAEQMENALREIAHGEIPSDEMPSVDDPEFRYKMLLWAQKRARQGLGNVS